MHPGSKEIRTTSSTPRFSSRQERKPGISPMMRSITPFTAPYSGKVVVSSVFLKKSSPGCFFSLLLYSKSSFFFQNFNGVNGGEPRFAIKRSGEHWIVVGVRRYRHIDKVPQILQIVYGGRYSLAESFASVEHKKMKSLKKKMKSDVPPITTHFSRYSTNGSTPHPKRSDQWLVGFFAF